ncbi:hypothetical protein Gotri_018830 [Gossypium trilobum]|uniref:Uncharacterized protein n=1 Tax=Gossypium trilobum TaxID=34281 RepID=A0A7J9EAV7_9ROSI|nr:hypothetical protein [Gossypium trilobum]
MSELWDFTHISVTQNNLQDCFTFGKVDLVPTVEEYTTLLCCPRIQVDKVILEPPTSDFLKETNEHNWDERAMRHGPD